jgi:hypothetical protein
MRLDLGFRVSLYLTLAMAGLCLAVAEQPFLPGIFLLAGPLLGLLGLAFLLEGRWALPPMAANLLGLAAAAGWGVWLDMRLFQPTEPWRETIPMPAALLPYVGPLLLLGVALKLLRPKHTGDYWALQGLGLLQVALACVLTESPVFGALLLAYVVSAVWSLDLFHLWREARGASRPIAPGMPALRAICWVLVAAAVSLVPFLLVPRPAEELWNPLAAYSAGRPPHQHAETGYSEVIDLNRTGRIEVRDDVALIVSAEDATGAPKRDLDSGQRWRGPILDVYRDGRWLGGAQMPPAPLPVPNMGGMRPDQGGRPLLPRPLFGDLLPRPVRARQLFDLGPRQYFLTFTYEPKQAVGLFTADPAVMHAPTQQPGQGPVLVLSEEANDLVIFQELQGALVPVSHPSRQRFRYRQVTVPPEEEGLGPPLVIQEEYLRSIQAQPAPGLTAWTRQLAERLAEPGGPLVPADVRLERAAEPLAEDHPDGVLPRERWEKVARALADHLAHSGEYTYTLDLRRQDQDLDPALDFLANVKQGHCNRYAGGLALMLRALGIPARVVTGFRGADSRGDGSYEVHQNQAHSWVEAAVSRPGPDGRPQLHWLALEPSPAYEAPPPPPFSLSRWWDGGRDAGRKLWQDFVVDYDSEAQKAVWSDLAERLQRGVDQLVPAGRPWLAAGLGLAAALAGGGFVFRRRRRRTPEAPVSPVPFYRRLLAILARRRRLRPLPVQTPREFGAAAGQVLAAAATTRPLAALPVQVADLLYRVRYGGRPLSADEGCALERRLDELDAALAVR